MNKIWLHGEVLITQTKGEIPKEAKLVKSMRGSYKVADSETTGNHHLLEDMKGLNVYEYEGKFYVRPSKPLTVKCVDEKRHDAIEIPPCKADEVFVFDKQVEVDHLTDEIRNVQD